MLGRGASQHLRALGKRDGRAPGPKPGSFSFLPTSVPGAPFPLLKQGMLLPALCLGILGLPSKPVPGPSPPCPPQGQLLW